MSNELNGSIIGVNNPTAASPGPNPLAGGASGLWSIDAIQLARQRSEWPRYYGPSPIVASGGTTVDYLDGNDQNFYRVHIFTGAGAFTVSSAPPTATAQYLVIAGGGGNGGPFYPNPYGIGVSPGPGGAGGTNLVTSFAVAAGTYPVSIGAAGTSGPATNPGNPGGPTTFALPTPVAMTGGGGGGFTNGAKPGGSGGGGGLQTVPGPNQPILGPPICYPGAPGIPGQGNPGVCLAGGGSLGPTSQGIPTYFPGSLVVVAGTPITPGQ